jgi:hypothetical protein
MVRGVAPRVSEACKRLGGSDLRAGRRLRVTKGKPIRAWAIGIPQKLVASFGKVSRKPNPRVTALTPKGRRLSESNQVQPLRTIEYANEKPITRDIDAPRIAKRNELNSPSQGLVKPIVRGPSKRARNPERLGYGVPAGQKARVTTARIGANTNKREIARAVLIHQRSGPEARGN